MIAWITLALAVASTLATLAFWTWIRCGGQLDRARYGKKLDEYEWSCMVKEAHDRKNRKRRSRRQAGRVYR